MSSSNRGTKSASADEPQIVRRTDKRHGNKVRESKRSLAGHSYGSKVRNSKDSLAGPSHVWKPQLDPKKRCIAAAPGDN